MKKSTAGRRPAGEGYFHPINNVTEEVMVSRYFYKIGPYIEHIGGN